MVYENRKKEIQELGQKMIRQESLKLYEKGGSFDQITRRDWLAGLALQGMMDSPMSRSCPPAQFSSVLPRIAYELANAMIVEGRKE